MDDPKNVNEVVDTILENIAWLQGTPKDVNEEWLKRSKDLIVVTEAMNNPDRRGTGQNGGGLRKLFGTWL